MPAILPSGFSGLAFEPKKYEFIQAPSGFRALNFQTNRQQFLESKIGLKSISVAVNYDGKIAKIEHK